MSLRPSMSARPAACSGDMYDGVPTTLAAEVMISPPPSALATPNAVSSARPDSAPVGSEVSPWERSGHAELASRNFTSWNQLDGWLQQVES
jgi:hypothetical protein